MKKISFVFILICTSSILFAQTQFFSKVKIEYEKTVAVHQLYKDMDPTWFERIKERIPASAKNYYVFVGDTSKSIYKPGKESDLDPRSWYRPVADKNVVYNDYEKGTTISQKPVYEETFLVEDSMSRIKWKLTADTRIIAGFECRKAIGILDDTIGIFAFYTDEIMVNGGPEGIHGLPGMILGVGIPRIHATWFATKVEFFDVNMKEVTPATKGKKVNKASMMQALDKVLRQWGEYGSKLIVNYAI